MPCRVSYDVLERSNDLVTVPRMGGVKYQMLANSPVAPNGKRRPRRALLQSAPVCPIFTQSVTGTQRSNISGYCGEKNGTPVVRVEQTYLVKETRVDGQLYWGGKRPKR